jgi:hypothetical protein
MQLTVIMPAAGPPAAAGRGADGYYYLQLPAGPPAGPAALALALPLAVALRLPLAVTVAVPLALQWCGPLVPLAVTLALTIRLGVAAAFRRGPGPGFYPLVVAEMRTRITCLHFSYPDFIRTTAGPGRGSAGPALFLATHTQSVQAFKQA